MADPAVARLVVSVAVRSEKHMKLRAVGGDHRSEQVPVAGVREALQVRPISRTLMGQEEDSRLPREIPAGDTCPLQANPNLALRRGDRNNDRPSVEPVPNAPVRVAPAAANRF